MPAMPPRRSARAENKPPSEKRVEKRAASPDPVPPPAKRQNSGTKTAANATKSTGRPAPLKRARSNAGTKATATATKSKDAAPKKAPTLHLNTLPTAPEHTRPANQIFVWGAGNFGQFGMGPGFLDEFDKPKKNTWIEKKMEEGAFGEPSAGIECVAAGGMHTMFVDEKGTIWTCGVNDEAALGRITQNVPDPEKEGAFISVDILTTIPYPIQSLVDENFRAVTIAAGDSICAAISTEGELRVWGSFRANEGALGFSDGSKHQYKPSPILQLPPRDGEKVASVAAGNNHLVVLTTHGNIYTWGAGEQGQLGRKILARHKIHGTQPEKVTLQLRSRKALVIGAGNYTSFAVDEQGTVWGWGLNNRGQTGTGFEDAEEDSTIPQPLKVFGLSKEELGGATVVQIAGGEHHTLFLTSDGRVYACGRSDGGQIGVPDSHPTMKDSANPGMVTEPTLVTFSGDDDPIVHISAGTHNNMATTAGGALYAWGEGNQGELGIGDDTDAKTPTIIVRREGNSWKAIAAACGGQHTLGLFRKRT